MTEEQYQKGIALIIEILDYAWSNIADSLKAGKGNINFSAEYRRLLEETPEGDLLKETAAEAFSRDLWTVIPLTLPPEPKKGIAVLQILFAKPADGEPTARALTAEELNASVRTGADGLQRFEVDETGKAYGVPSRFSFTQYYIFDALQYIRNRKPIDPGFFYTRNGAEARFLENINPQRFDRGEVKEERSIVPNPETGFDEVRTLHTWQELPTNSREIQVFLEIQEGAEASAAVLPSVATVLDMVQEQIQAARFETATASILLRDFMRETGEKNYPAARRKLTKAIKFLYFISLKNAKDKGGETGHRLFTDYEIPPETGGTEERYSLTLSPLYLATLKAIPYNIKRSRNLHKIRDRYSRASRIARDIAAAQRYDANHPNKDGLLSVLTILDKYFPDKEDKAKHGEKHRRIDPFFAQLDELMAQKVFDRLIFYEGKRRYSLTAAKERYKTAASFEGVKIEGVNPPGHGDYREVQKKQAEAKAKTRKKPRRKSDTQK